MDLLAWLKESGCAQMAMEAADVCWKPVLNILSDGPFALIVANDAPIKNVPGRMIEAMIAGERNPNRLAQLVDRRIRATHLESKALRGRITPPHRLMLKLRLEQYDACRQAVEQIEHTVDDAITRMGDWAGPEKSWNRYLLSTVDTALSRAGNFLAAHAHGGPAASLPIEKGVTVVGNDKVELEQRLQRALA